MAVELIQTLSLVSYVLAALFLSAAVAIFFLLDVPKLYGDVTGANARKAIESIRRQNEETGAKAYKPSPVNLERGRTTDKISLSGNLKKQISSIGINVETQKLNTAELAPSANETTLLNNYSNELPFYNKENTNQTTVLSVETYNAKFMVDAEIDFTGSEEIIE